MPRTLLLADDSTTIQRVVELTFAGHDIAVVVFSDGDNAMAWLERTPPDIVLADIGMPGQSGYDMARHIKRTPALSHIPVILLSGAFEPIDEALAVEVGCDAVLTKPFEPQQVVTRVKALLARPEPQSRGDEVENYFEQLDQAFATLVVAPPPAAADVALRSVSQTPAPSLTDAFSALLAAERRSGPVPQAMIAHVPVASIPPDELVERVVRRVMDRLSETGLREAVAAIVSTTAERLVREEIERIKSNFK